MNIKLLSFVTASTAFFSIVAMTGSANASTYSKTDSVDYSITDILNTPLTIEKFSGSLGNLDSVTLDFTSSVLGDASFTNRGSRTANVNVNIGAESDLTVNNQTLITITPTWNSVFAVGPLKTQPNQPVVLNGLSATTSQTTTFTDSNLLQSFIGTGDLSLLFSAYSTSYVGGAGNLSSSIDTSAKASLIVHYNFTRPHKVPEPSATLGIGLIAGLCLLSQRKRSFRQV